MKMLSFEVIARKKALLVEEGLVIGAKGYRLYKSFNGGKSWKYWTRLQHNKYSFFTFFRLVSRFFRLEISGLYKISNQNYICIAKKRIYYFDLAKNVFVPSFKVKKGSRPLNIAINNKGDAYFGEYFSNKKRSEVCIYKSDDLGRNWNVIYTFPPNSIRHVHGVFFDYYENKLWVTTGDDNGECLIGYTDNDFSSFKILFGGGQDVRTVKLIFLKDRIVYGTDTQKTKNFIYIIDRKLKNKRKIQEIPGSVIYSCVLDKLIAINTTVEPSRINRDKRSYLFISIDKGETWDKIFCAPKDIWHEMLFQFGSMIFPNYYGRTKFLFFTGRALRKIDGKTLRIGIGDLIKEGYSQ